MASRRSGRPAPPLTAAKLDELALNYVGRFATSRAKLITYLRRKLRERGWDGDAEPPLDGLADRLVRLGYVDDSAFALSKARSLTARGYGERRVRQALAVAGVGEDDAASARQLAEEQAVEAALRFARRRQLGPFAAEPMDAERRERALAAMMRAGHRLGLARAILHLAPGEDADIDALVNGR